ncbi:MAG: LysE family translocator [Burkholderiales bacterium]
MLTLDALLAIALFSFVSSITPGPNNLMLLASGVNHGIRASMPHLMGVNLGFLVLLLAVGFGLGAVFAVYPVVYTLMKWLGIAYLLYLVYAIAGSSAPSGAQVGSKPIGFWAAAAFQWVNPKAWIMAVSVFSSYLPPDHSLLAALWVAVLFAFINAPCIAAWAVFGATLRDRLRSPRVLRIFNCGMAALLFVSLIPLLRTA